MNMSLVMMTSLNLHVMIKNENLDKDGYNSEAYKHLLKRTQNALKGLITEYIKKDLLYSI